MSDDKQSSFNTPKPGDKSSSPDSKQASDFDSRLEHKDSRGFTPSQALGGSRSSGAWEPPTPEELQAQMPQYKVLEVLGRGGMGAVYKGWQTSLDRYVAIKILPPDLEDGDVNFSARFKQEAKTMARLSHPGIVPVYDAGETVTGLFYFVMEFVEGSDVSQMVRQQGKLDPAHALAITAHVCDALTYAHEHGVIHRDIKPANIMLNQEGQVKVADFGLAKSTELGANSGLTKTTMTVGTPDYIAPEALVMGVYSDHRADLYAVGVMLYNMLTGEIPRGRWKLPSERVGSDVRFDAIINKAMETEREDRYQSAREIRRELDVIQSTPLEKVSPPVQQAAPARKPVMQEREHSPEAPASKPAASPSPPKRGAKVAKAGKMAGASRKKSNTVPIFAVGGVLAALAVGAIFLHKPKSSLPANATKDRPFVNSLGMKFVPVPIGGGPTKGTTVLFSVWDTRVQDYTAYAAANPNAEDKWTKVPKADGVPMNQEPEHPVVGVSWGGAQAFCQWLTKKESAEGKLPQGFKYRLPSDEEWSWAVGLPPELGATPVEKSEKNSVDFPWGKNWPPTKKVGNYADETFHRKLQTEPADKTKDAPWMAGYDDGYVSTSPVGSFPANAFGLYDMGGNVWQWCEDWFDATHKDRVMRGASWRCESRSELLSSNRLKRGPWRGFTHYGFRCVLSAVSPTSSGVLPAAVETPPEAAQPPSSAPSSISATSAAEHQIPRHDGKPADMSKPVRVFILMGQTNMLGMGKIAGDEDSLENAVKTKNKYTYLVDDKGSWLERRDVRNVRVMFEKGRMQLFNNEWMNVKDTKTIGPEFGIGHVLGNAIEAPVMILKSCIGNRSLGWDLLPPGSEPYEFEGTMVPGYRGTPENPKGNGQKPESLWYAGKQYDDDTDSAKRVLAQLDKYYPGAKGYEVAGFFFWQGEKDCGSAENSARYEKNLVQFIKQLRKDFAAPNAKFVLATLGEATKGSSGNGGKVLNAQLAVDGSSGKHPEFKGNVATVYSNPMAQGGGGGGHYGGNAEVYMDVGEAMGKAMLDLLKK